MSGLLISFCHLLPNTDVIPTFMPAISTICCFAVMPASNPNSPTLADTKGLFGCPSMLAATETNSAAGRRRSVVPSPIAS